MGKHSRVGEEPSNSRWAKEPVRASDDSHWQYDNIDICREVLTRELTGVRPTIHIGELIFASGDAMKDVITFAFDLPKDNKVKDKESFSCMEDLKLKWQSLKL